MGDGGFSGQLRGKTAALIVAVCLPTAAPMAEPAPVTGNITVIDGDTVERGGERWRLIGLDAPEIHGARCAGERERGILAAARLVGLLHAKGGRLIGDGREKYGRRLGRLIIGWPSTGDEDWAAIAIREGLALTWDGKGKRMDWCTP